MNVMLNIPVDTGTERTGTTGRRANDAGAGGDDFGALFAEVGRKTNADRGPQFDPRTGREEAPANADAAEAGATPRDARRRPDGGQVAWDATPEVTAEEAGKGRSADTADGLPPADGKPDRRQHQGEDAPADVALRRGGGQPHRAGNGHAPPTEGETADADAGTNRPLRQDAGQTSRPDDGDGTPAAPSKASVVETPDEAKGSGRRRDAGDVDVGRPARRDAGRTDSAGDGDGELANPNTTGVGGATVAMSPATAGTKPADDGKAAAPTDNGKARQTAGALDNAAAARQTPPGDAGKPVKDATGATSGGASAPHGKSEDGSAVVSPSASKPVAAERQGDSAPVRYWARGDTAAALAAAAARDQRPQSDKAAGKPQGERQSAPAHGGNRPIDVQVASYERHPAPVSAGGATKAVLPTDGAAGDAAATPAAPGAAEDAAGSAEALDGVQQRQSRQPLMSAAQGASPATAKAPSALQAIAPTDQTRTPDAAGQNEGSKSNKDDHRSQASTTPPGNAADKRQPVNGAPPSGGNPATGTAASAVAPAAPLAAGVASGIVNALDAARSGGGAPSARHRIRWRSRRRSRSGPSTLNLDMREYGQVDLRISLKGNAVSIQLKADRPETADALARDDASLREVLHRAGYEAQQVQIDKRDAAGPRLGDTARRPASSRPAGRAPAHRRGTRPAASVRRRRTSARRRRAMPMASPFPTRTLRMPIARIVIAALIAFTSSAAGAGGSGESVRGRDARGRGQIRGAARACSMRSASPSRAARNRCSRWP